MERTARFGHVAQNLAYRCPGSAKLRRGVRHAGWVCSRVGQSSPAPHASRRCVRSAPRTDSVPRSTSPPKAEGSRSRNDGDPCRDRLLSRRKPTQPRMTGIGPRVDVSVCALRFGDVLCPGRSAARRRSFLPNARSRMGPGLDRTPLSCKPQRDADAAQIPQLNGKPTLIPRHFP